MTWESNVAAGAGSGLLPRPLMTASVTGRIASSNTVDIPSCVLLVKGYHCLSMWELKQAYGYSSAFTLDAPLWYQGWKWELPRTSRKHHHARMLGRQTWLRCC